MIFSCTLIAALALNCAGGTNVVDTFIAGGTLSAVREAVRAHAAGKTVFLAAPRPYLGEDRAGTFILDRLPSDDVKDELVREMFNPAYGIEDAYRAKLGKGWSADDFLVPMSNRPPENVSAELALRTTPFLVKRACDRYLLSRKIPYLTGVLVDRVRRLPDGSCEIVTISRGGERHYLAKEFIDRRLRILPEPFKPGVYRMVHRVARGTPAKIMDVEREIAITEDSPWALRKAERELRDASFAPNQHDAAPFPYVKGGLVRALPPSARTVPAYDVVVVGGGTGGAPAAFAAAREGAKVLVVEFMNALGGIATEGRIGSYYFGNKNGFTAELERGVKTVGVNYCQAKGEWFRRELGRLGADIWFAAAFVDARVENGTITAVKVAFSEGGSVWVPCKVVIDATGNSDVAAAAGCRTSYLTPDELCLQGAGVAPQFLVRKGGNSDIGFVNVNDPNDLTYFLLRARMSLPDRTWNVAQLIGTRERRRIVGEFVLDPVDVIVGRTYADTICQTISNFDTHGQTCHPIFFDRSPGERGDQHPANIPFRCYLPKEVDGLLVTGLGISAHRDAMPVVRMQADIQNGGYAMGLAAAMAVREGIPPRKVDVKSLQRKLVEEGTLGREVLTMADSPAPKEEERCVLRKEAAAAAMSALKDAAWDKGWNYKGMSQFGRSVSEMDRTIIALARGGCTDAVPVIIAKASELKGDDAYSHFRALAMAFEKLGDAKAIPALVRLLKLPGVAGHAFAPDAVPPVPRFSNAEANRERSDVLKELCLARALYRLGDAEGLGRQTLEAYAKDPRGAFSAHAKMVLGRLK